MQEYFVRLFGSYRRFIHDQAMEPLLRPSRCVSAATQPQQQQPAAGGRGGARERGLGRESRALGGDPGASPGHGPQSGSAAARHAAHDDMLRGHGLYFDQPAFVAHRCASSGRSCQRLRLPA
jgi:hypothetical protein